MESDIQLDFTYMKHPYNKVFSFWNKNGYELFLYQNYVYCFFILFTGVLSIKVEKGILIFFICSLIIFVLSIGLNVLRRKIENILFRKLKMLIFKIQ